MSGDARLQAAAEGAGLAVTEDALLGGRLRLRQPAEGFRAAIDPILLAAAAPQSAPQSARQSARQSAEHCRVLDLGCGVGTAGLALLARLPAARVTGLEIDPVLAALARENAVLNRFENRYEAVVGDVRTADLAGFDLVLCNPPFLAAGAGTRSAREGRDRAMQEGRAGEAGGAALEDWARAAVTALRPRGMAVFVHRADRLEALLAALSGVAGAFEIFPLWPRAADPTLPAPPAKRVILRARKGLRSPTSLLPGLVLHLADGDYTAAAEAVLRDGVALPL